MMKRLSIPDPDIIAGAALIQAQSKGQGVSIAVGRIAFELVGRRNGLGVVLDVSDKKGWLDSGKFCLGGWLQVFLSLSFHFLASCPLLPRSVGRFLKIFISTVESLMRRPFYFRKSHYK